MSSSSTTCWAFCYSLPMSFTFTLASCSSSLQTRLCWSVGSGRPDRVSSPVFSLTRWVCFTYTTRAGDDLGSELSAPWHSTVVHSKLASILKCQVFCKDLHIQQVCHVPEKSYRLSHFHIMFWNKRTEWNHSVYCLVTHDAPKLDNALLVSRRDK